MKNINNTYRNICFRVTRRCNLRCDFCLAPFKEKDLKLIKIKNAIKILKQKGLESIRIGGGEPTIRKDINEIFRFCLSEDLDLRIITNLFELDYSIFDGIEPSNTIIKTSLHGNREMHDKMVGKECFNSVVKNINKLVKNGYSVNIHYVITKINLKPIEDIIKMCISLNAKKLSFISFIPRGLGKISKSKYFLTDDNINQFRKEFEIFKGKYGNIIKLKYNNLYEKEYYVFETDGNLWLEKEDEKKDVFIEKIV